MDDQGRGSGGPPNGDVRSAVELTREFRQRLRDLRVEVGDPKAGVLITKLAPTGLKLSPATLSEFASDKRPLVLPQADFVEAYVTACLRFRGDTPEEVRRQVYSWLNWRNGIAVTAGLPVAPVEEPDATEEPVEETPAAAEAPPVQPARRSRRLWLLLPVAVLVGALLVVATQRFRVVAVARDANELKVLIGRPDLSNPDSDGCAERFATVYNSLSAPMGTAKLEDCRRELRLSWTDHLADGYCIYVLIEWPDGSVDRTEKACPAGELEQSTIPRRGPAYTATLTAHNVEQQKPS
ncbi:hypothetical protein HPO96_18485 [Kribbella sandramycini]|uniref:Uncharacterized protein n=1 Tax=Kribbella sandramycini TaxID=60450 RepID=A0A7Y4L2E7_9ACTN|nr:hypothetical protein [Kribbella sandramycini]MBB6564533.1 hypothetical protein [Kribbella sandramycini]NOL42237.1 hypothetical protein [Kribbella sandramycini]